MQDKRGLSAIIATLLIILLVIVAAGIVWFVVRNLLQESTEDLSFGRFTIDMEILNAVKDDSNNWVSVSVKRNAGEGSVKGVNFVIASDTESEVVERDAELGELESETFTFDLDAIGMADATEVSIAAIYETSPGNEATGGVLDTFSFGSGTVEPGAGGNGATCGDGTCDPGEDVLTCPEDCGEGECGDGSLDAGEECDDENTDDGDGCSAICEIEGEGPVCGNSVQETGEGCDDGNTDDGDGCFGNCSGCEPGYNTDGQGGCVGIQYLEVGVIDNVWPPGSGIYFDDANLTRQDALYYGRAAYFPIVNTTHCFLIIGYTYDGDVYENAIVELSLENPLGIAAGSDYEIWESIAECQEGNDL